jgi:hypothetical protein
MLRGRYRGVLPMIEICAQFRRPERMQSWSRRSSAILIANQIPMVTRRTQNPNAAAFTAMRWR